MKMNTRFCLTIIIIAGLFTGSFSYLFAAHHEATIIEVRVYKINPGKMDDWERFFHDKLVEPQEKAGMKIVAAYRTLEDENLFVWMRQFANEASKPAALAGFYESDNWLNTLRPELREKELIDKVEVVYTVSPSK